MKLKLMVFLAGCNCIISCVSETQSDADQKPKPVEGPKLVGRVASIPADRRFVLIQSYGKWEMESGAILTTRGPEERTANLRTTGEKLGEFVAADFQSGSVEKGDAVYSQHIPKPVQAPILPELPEEQKLPQNGDLQKNI